jgi:guanylate kinase
VRWRSRDLDLSERMLFILSGLPGGGKSEFLRRVRKRALEYDAHIEQKLTTRQMRPDAVPTETDSILVSEEEFAQFRQMDGFLTYMLGDEEFGLYLPLLQARCVSHRIVFVTIIEPDVIRAIQRAMPNIRVETIWIATDASLREQRMATDTQNVEFTDARRRNTEFVQAAYDRDPTLYQHVINNNGSPEELEQHVRELLDRYNKPKRRASEDNRPRQTVSLSS